MTASERISHPLVLVDGGDDGMDEEGWVEKIVTESEARRLMEPMNPDPDLCVLVVTGTAHLRPDDPAAPDDQQWWRPCNADEEGAIEFWVIQADDSGDAA